MVINLRDAPFPIVSSAYNENKNIGEGFLVLVVSFLVLIKCNLKLEGPMKDGSDIMGIC